MKRLQTHVRIERPAAHVWMVLNDFGSYPTWNPFIREMVRDGENSYRIRMFLKEKGFQSYKIQVSPQSTSMRLSWIGYFHLPGLIDGNHLFQVKSTIMKDDKSGNGESSEVEQSESFGGILVPLVWTSFIQRYLLPSFVALNENLKAYCEDCELPNALY